MDWKLHYGRNTISTLKIHVLVPKSVLLLKRINSHWLSKIVIMECKLYKQWKCFCMKLWFMETVDHPFIFFILPAISLKCHIICQLCSFTYFVMFFSFRILVITLKCRKLQENYTCLKCVLVSEEICKERKFLIMINWISEYKNWSNQLQGNLYTRWEKG